MNYAKIKHYDIANGEGIRISLFVSGCKFNCKGCFNEETQDFNYGTQYTKDTQQEILRLVSNVNIDGLSILGGDPLWQSPEDIEQLKALVCQVKKINKTIWIWSGFTWEQLLSEINYYKFELISMCDVFVDGKFEEDKRNLKLKWRGSENQRVIDVKETLKQKKIITIQND